MTEYEFLLQDRIQKIKSINEKYDLENNAYISYSGGKDSTVLHYLIDEALPNNNIPRVFINTGIEFKAIKQYVTEFSEKDKRFIILSTGKNIKETLLKVGYPFKSKDYSNKYKRLKVAQEKNRKITPFLLEYFKLSEKVRPSKFQCPEKLLYQRETSYKGNWSDKCCYEFKKSTMKKYEKESCRKIAITGMQQEEGGQRAKLTCIISNGDSIKRFHPLAIISNDWEDWYITNRNIKLCKLYYPPFNFERTGCKGCPFNIYLKKELDLLEILLPEEKKQCEIIWKPVYDEYRRIGYRLDKDNGQQFFDF